MKSGQVKPLQHVAIIMDGNRRWARKRGLAGIRGHARAMDEVVEKLIERAGERGVKYLTMWAFSTENWKRDKQEVSGLMNLFRKALEEKVSRFIEKGAKLRIIGDLSKFDKDIREGLRKAEELSKDNNKITVVFALNYGGRDELERAMKKSLNNGKGLAENLDTVGIPDPDLVIRTGGEQRLSGFLPWQSVYSELYFTDVLFPDFDGNEFDRALEEYSRRQRRFGK